MDSNWQSPGGPKGSGYYAASGPRRDLEGSWGEGSWKEDSWSSSTAATVAPPESEAAPGRPQAPEPPRPPQPPHPPVASVAPTSPDVALPRPAPFPAKRRSPWISPWRLRGAEARRQLLLVAGFVALAVLGALVVAVSLSKDAESETSRVVAGPGGPNPFARPDDPVPALTENDSVLPPADAAQLPPDPNATTTTAAPAQAGLQATATPTPVGGSGGSGSGSGSPPSPVPAKSVTLVYSATPSDITINGNDSPKLNVGDKLEFKRASGEAGGVAIAAPGTFVESRAGYDYMYTVLAPGTYNVTITSQGHTKSIPVTVS